LTAVDPEQLREVLRAGAAAWNAWREDAHAHVIDLRGAELSGLALTGVNFSRCNLHGAIFDSADLQRADFQHADLVRTRMFQANLTGANLRGANLRSAYLARSTLNDPDLSNASLHASNLQGAGLRRANLEFCLLVRCDLRGANFDHAVCGGTTFAQLKLSDARLMVQKNGRLAHVMTARTRFAMRDADQFPCSGTGAPLPTIQSPPSHPATAPNGRPVRIAPKLCD